jgi:hypothetical protein
MARISRDNFHGGYQITGLEDDIAKARANAQFNQDMNPSAEDVMNAPGEALVGAVRTTGRAAAGGVGFGVRMVRDRRFRYIMQAVLHFPMAFFVVFFFAVSRMPVGTDYSAMAHEEAQATTAQVFGHSALIGLVVAVVWTAAYIVLRTRPKLRRLNQY